MNKQSDTQIHKQTDNVDYCHNLFLLTKNLRKSRKMSKAMKLIFEKKSQDVKEK